PGAWPGVPPALPSVLLPSAWFRASTLPCNVCTRCWVSCMARSAETRVSACASGESAALTRRRSCGAEAVLAWPARPSLTCRAATGGSRRTAGGVGRGATAIAVEGFKVLGVDAARFGRVNGANGHSVRDGQRFACAHQIHVVLNKRVWIGTPQGNQHLVHAGVRHRIAASNAKQIVAAAYRY